MKMTYLSIAVIISSIVAALYVILSPSESGSSTKQSFGKSYNDSDKEYIKQNLMSVLKWGKEGVVSTHLSISWIKKQVRMMFESNDISKVAVLCYDAIKEYVDKNISEALEFTHIICALDNKGEIKKLILINDMGSGDPEVENLLGSEKMVVINR